MKNEQQSQNLLLKVDPRSTFRNNFLQPATNVFVAQQVDHARWKTGNIDKDLEQNNVARQVEGFCVSYFAAFKQTTTTTATRTSQNKSLISKTIAMHVRYKSLFISLPSCAKQEREMAKFCVVYRTWTTTAKFSYFHSELNAVVAYYRGIAEPKRAMQSRISLVKYNFTFYLASFSASRRRCLSSLSKNEIPFRDNTSIRISTTHAYIWPMKALDPD